MAQHIDLAPNTIDAAIPWLCYFELFADLFQNQVVAVGSRNVNHHA